MTPKLSLMGVPELEIDTKGCSQIMFTRRDGQVVNFYKVETVNEGGQEVKKSQKLVNVVCEKPLIQLLVKQRNKISVMKETD